MFLPDKAGNLKKVDFFSKYCKKSIEINLKLCYDSFVRFKESIKKCGPDTIRESAGDCATGTLSIRMLSSVLRHIFVPVVEGREKKRKSLQAESCGQQWPFTP
jgi:hypothetical protein